MLKWLGQSGPGALKHNHLPGTHNKQHRNACELQQALTKCNLAGTHRQQHLGGDAGPAKRNMRERPLSLMDLGNIGKPQSVRFRHGLTLTEYIGQNISDRTHERHGGTAAATWR